MAEASPARLESLTDSLHKETYNNMNKIEFVKAAMDFNNPNPGDNITDDFQWTDSAGGQPMDKAGFLGMIPLLKAAMPDLTFVIEDIKEDGDDVLVTSHMAGTFTNALDLSAMGMGVVPATGAKLTFPTSTDRMSFSGGKISKIHGLNTGPDAGMAGMLKTLGVKMG
jgi:predicted ester cyclase